MSGQLYLASICQHERDQWAYPPSDKEVQRLVREVTAALDRLGW